MERASLKNSACPICSITFSFFIKKIECSSCKLLVCKEHCLNRSDSLICEQCEKNQVKKEHFPDVLFQIKTLKNELSHLEKEKKKYRLDLNTKNDIINRIDKQKNSSLEIHLEKVEMMQKKILQETEKITSEEKLLKYLEQSLAESKNNEVNTVKKLNVEMQALYRARAENDEATLNQINLIKELDKLNKELRGLVPIHRLSLLICNDCKVQVKHRFREVFDSQLTINGHDSFMSSISTNPVSQDIPREGHVCRTCNII
jgi:chromosome segregation ATPase